jgi:hypothetical protein
MRPSSNTIAYKLLCDLFVGNFVLVWPVNPTIYFVWMGRVESDVVKDQENKNYRKVYVQWCVLVKKGIESDEELYHKCWLNKWKSNHVDPKQWVKISCVTFSFLAKSNIIVHSTINISATHAFKAKASLDGVDNNSYAL